MKTVTKIFAIVLVLGLVFGFAPTGEVKAAEGAPVCNTNTGLCYTTIQAAITAASDGHTIYIENGTYTESLNIYKSLTLTGESEAGVIIDAIGTTSYGIDASGDYTTYFSNFTLNNTGTYGLKISGENAFTHINHVTVNDSGRSGIDLNGVAGGTINDVTITDSVYGVGLALTDTSNVAVSNVTTSGNAWGGMAIYTRGESYTGGSTDITLTGTNSFAEAQNFYIQEENGYEVTDFTQTDFSFTVVNETDAPGFILFYKTQAEATAVALGMTNPVDSVITDLTSDTFLVVPGLSIQAAHDAAAPGDTIIVADGTYTVATEPVATVGLVNIYKQITIKAADDGNEIRPVIDATGRDGVFKIHANTLIDGEIIIEGFDLTGDRYTGTAITTMLCGNTPPADVIIRDNLVHGMIAGVNVWGSDSFCPVGTDYKIFGIEITGNDFYNLGEYGVTDGQGFGIAIEGLSDSAEAGGISAVISGNTFEDINDESADLTKLGTGIAFVGGSANAQVFDNVFIDNISVDIGLLQTDVATTDIHDNDLSGGVYGVAAMYTTGDPADASPNWWGTAVDSLIAARIMGDVTYEPYWVNAEMTILSSTLPTTVYVDDSFTYSPESCGGHICGYDAFVTIQEGIDGVAEGGTVNVAAGEYDEYMEIGKALSLLGPNEGNSAGKDPETRVDEAIIKHSVDWLSMYVYGEDVTIDGFKFDGALLDPGLYYVAGIYVGASDVTVTNNIFTNHEGIPIFTSGGTYADGTYITDVIISNNLVTDDVPSQNIYNHGIYLQSTVATVIGNVIENVRTGIQVQPYKTPGSGLVENNVFSAYRRPVWFNYSDNDAADWLFYNNLLNGIARPTGEADNPWDGIRVETYTKGNVVFAGNTISIGDADTTVINMFRKIGHKGGTINLEATLDNNTWEKVVVVRDSLGVIRETTLVTPALNGDATFFSTIQSAIDDTYTVAGDTVDVGSGTYTEQVTITKDITLLGAGEASTTIRAFPSMPVCFTTTKDHRPVVCVKDATATIDGFTIDGLGLGNTNVNFEGVAFRNAGGTLQNSLVKDIRDTPFSGAQHGVAVYVYNDDTTARTVHVLDNEIIGFQKNAMALNASATNPLTVDVQRNTITGAGSTAVTAQNGIQVDAAAGGGLVRGNTITGITYDGSGWVATSILIFNSQDLDTISNTITDAHMGIYYLGASGLIDDNTLSIIEGAGSAYGIYVDGGNAEIRNNDLTFQTTPFAGSLGIGVGVWDANDVAANVHDNIVSGFDWGLDFTESSDPLETGNFTSISAVNNTLYGNTNALYVGGPIPVTPYIFHNKLSDGTNFGIYNDLTGTLNAEANWWGSMFGPATDMYVGDVDFIKWCGDEACTFLLPDDGGVIEIGPGLIEETIVINQPNLTIRALDGTTIAPTSGACFEINASYTTIEAATNLGAVCVPPAGENGVNVADGLEEVVIKGLEFDGSAGGVDGIHFNGIANLMIIDNWFHDLTGDAIEFTAQPAGVVSIQGNLFQENDGLGINASTFTVPAEYNSWGHVDGAAAGDGASANVDTDPYTHVDLYIGASGVAQVDEQIILTVYGNLENVFGTTFSFVYPDSLELVGTPTNLSAFVGPLGTSTSVFTVATGTRTITFEGYMGYSATEPNPPVSGVDTPLFSATFNVLATGGILNLVDTNDEFIMITDTNPAPSTNIYACALVDGELVNTAYSVIGKVSMQGRSINSGVPVVLTGTGVYGPYGVTSIQAVGNNYTITGVAAGEYVFSTNQPRYLNLAGGTNGITPTVDVDGNITLPSLVLKGGNAYWVSPEGIANNRVDGSDASVVGFNYGSTVDSDGDVNFDGIVDITDLTLVGGNWYLTSATAYGSWLP